MSLGQMCMDTTKEEQLFNMHYYYPNHCYYHTPMACSQDRYVFWNSAFKIKHRILVKSRFEQKLCINLSGDFSHTHLLISGANNGK